MAEAWSFALVPDFRPSPRTLQRPVGGPVWQQRNIKVEPARPNHDAPWHQFAEHLCPQNCILMPPEMPPIVTDAYGDIEKMPNAIQHEMAAKKGKQGIFGHLRTGDWRSYQSDGNPPPIMQSLTPTAVSSAHHVPPISQCSARLLARGDASDVINKFVRYCVDPNSEPAGPTTSYGTVTEPACCLHMGQRVCPVTAAGVVQDLALGASLFRLQLGGNRIGNSNNRTRGMLMS